MQCVYCHAHDGASFHFGCTLGQSSRITHHIPTKTHMWYTVCLDKPTVDHSILPVWSLVKYWFYFSKGQHVHSVYKQPLKNGGHWLCSLGVAQTLEHKHWEFYGSTSNRLSSPVVAINMRETSCPLENANWKWQIYVLADVQTATMPLHDFF